LLSKLQFKSILSTNVPNQGKMMCLMYNITYNI